MVRRAAVSAGTAVLAVGCLVYALTLHPFRTASSPSLDDGPYVERFQWTPEGKPICPNCGRSDQICGYRYGLIRNSLAPGYIAGGCVISADSPQYKCLACQTRFGKSPQAASVRPEPMP